MKNTEIKQIQAIRVGNIVNISLSGKLHKKICGSSKEADELFRLVLKAKEDPSEDNVRAIRCYINYKTRVAMLAGLESDPDSGEVFLSGFNTPLPLTLIEVVKEYHDNGYPLDAIINFWKLLMINPDKRVRTSLFDFIKTHDFVLTDKGYMIVYKAVYNFEEEKEQSPLASIGAYISNQYFHVKKDWKCSPNKYVVYKDTETDALAITKCETAVGWGWDSDDDAEQTLAEDLHVIVYGKLGNVYDSIMSASGEGEEEPLNEKVPVYTDMYTRTMRIVLGQPVHMLRIECDSDPSIDCSYGLHCGSTKYVNSYASSAHAVLACFVNPANIVAVPNYDKSKFRTTEYFPFALATYENGKIDIVSQKYYEDDYVNYEIEELEAQVALVKAGELPIPTADNSEPEERPMSELLKMLESRIIDLK
jgi:hypothetical protein